MPERPAAAPGQAWAGQGRDPGRECILCGRCLEVCPLFLASAQEELSPRGKFVLTQALTRPRKPGEQGPALSGRAAARLTSLCLSCGRCAQVCPQDLRGPELVAALRAAHPGLAGWLWGQWVDKARLLWPRAAGLARLLPRGLKALVPAVSGLKSLEDDRPPTPWLSTQNLPDLGQGAGAALFAGCTARYARPRWKEKAGKILRGLGYGLRDLDFTCCGSALASAGRPDLAVRAREHNLGVWEAAGRPLVVTACATCHAALAGYGQAPGVADPSAWVQGLRPLTALMGSWRPRRLEAAPRAVYYHVPCHDRGGADLAFFRPGLGSRLVRTSRDFCCGFGGVLRLAAPDLAEAVNARLWAGLAPPPAAQVLTGCSACALRLAATAPEGVWAGHWLDIFD